MNILVKLTKRESQIAELFAWGASKKDVSNRLFVSERTVENHARNIYDKIGCNKVNGLSAWWFCVKYNIPFDLSPLKKQVIAIMLLLFIIPEISCYDDDVMRVFRTRSTRTARASRSGRRKSDSDYQY